MEKSKIKLTHFGSRIYILCSLMYYSMASNQPISNGFHPLVTLPFTNISEWKSSLCYCIRKLQFWSWFTTNLLCSLRQVMLNYFLICKMISVFSSSYKIHSFIVLKFWWWSYKAFEGKLLYLIKSNNKTCDCVFDFLAFSFHYYQCQKLLCIPMSLY